MLKELVELGRLLRVRRIPPERLRELQDTRLRAVVRHAYERVPFYRERFRAAGFAPRAFRGLEDLARLPITTKEHLLGADPASLLTEGIDPATCVVSKTSGADGVRLDVYRSPHEARMRRLVNFRALLWAGLRPRDRIAVLGPYSARKPPAYERVGLFVGLNVPLTLPVDEQLERIRAFGPTVFWTYPSLLRALADHTDDRLFEVIRPRALITSAEVFDPLTRDRVLAGVDIETYNFYGSHELGRVASECRAHDGLHVAADQVVLECLDDPRLGGATDAGNAILTHLGAYTMPFIRYQIGDLVKWTDQRCECGSTLQTIEPPLGRMSDVVRLPSGRSVTAMSFNYIVRELPAVRRYRVVQRAIGRLEMSIVLASSAKNEERSALPARLAARVQERLGEPVRVEVRIVDTLADDRIKFRSFVSEIDRSSS